MTCMNIKVWYLCISSGQERKAFYGIYCRGFRIFACACVCVCKCDLYLLDGTENMACL